MLNDTEQARRMQLFAQDTLMSDNETEARLENYDALAEIAAQNSILEVLDEIKIPQNVINSEIVKEVLRPAVENAVYDTLRTLGLMRKLIEPISVTQFQDAIGHVQDSNMTTQGEQ